MVNLTEKEKYIIEDLKSQEELCIQKYAFYENMAYDPELKALFKDIKKKEEEHYQSLTNVLNGEVIESDVNDYSAKNYRPKANYHQNSAQEEKDHDSFLCTDSITMEKYVSGAYNFDLFQFGNNKLRKLLADIEVEEQNHAEMLYKYKVANKMA
jgi:spore coat protein CotF